MTLVTKTPGMIGGVLALPDGTAAGAAPLPLLAKPHRCFANARCGLFALLSHLAVRRVWLPSYLCPSVLEPLQALRIPHSFYRLSETLEIADQAWIDELGEGDLVVAIDYFGFRADYTALQRAREKGAWLVADASQALLTDSIGQDADFALYSPRKFVGVPDGGLLTCAAESGLAGIEPAPMDEAAWQRSYVVCALRRDHDLLGVDSGWFRRFQEAESAAPCGLTGMSDHSLQLLRGAFDFSQIATVRRENFQVLADRLSGFGLYESLPLGTVPLGFPVRVQNRSEVRQALFRASIFPPVHWELGDSVPKVFEESHQLASEVLTLVCDQRYTRSEMERTAEIFLQHARPSSLAAALG